MAKEDEYAEVVADAQADALHLYDLLLRELLTGEFTVTGPDQEANQRVEVIFTHMREFTCPPKPNDRLKAMLEAKRKA